MSVSDKQLKMFKVSEIKVPEDHIRKDVGDLTDLVNAWKTNSIIHPPTVRSNGELVCGYRRFCAAQQSNLEEIQVIVNDYINPEFAELEENSERKDLTFTEKLETARRIEEVLKPLGELRGKNKQDIDISTFTKKGSVPYLLHRFIEFKGQKRDFIAKYSNLGSGKMYDFAATIQDNAIPEIVEALDKNLISVRFAFDTVTNFPKRQKQRLNEATEKDFWTESTPKEINKANKARRVDQPLKGVKIASKELADKYMVIFVDHKWITYANDTIKRIPIRDFAVDDGSLLLIQTSNISLNRTIELINDWGFEYRGLSIAYNDLHPNSTDTVPSHNFEIVIWATIGDPPLLYKPLFPVFKSKTDNPWEKYFSESFPIFRKATYLVDQEWPNWDSLPTTDEVITKCK